MTRPRVALVHASPVIGGGPEAITMQAIAALGKAFELTLITYGDIDFPAFNAFYGTDVATDDINLVKVPPPVFKRGAALLGYRLARYCQSVAHHFEAMFSLYNGMDFGRPGLQYIIDPNFNSELVQQLNPSTRGKWFYKDTLFRKVYLKTGQLLARSSLDGLRQNVSVADSDWTGRMAKEHYGLDCRTLYPPVLDNDLSMPWEARENGFVTVGRISPDKNLEKIIAIVRGLRGAAPDLHLHIIGRIYDSRYAKRLEASSREDGDWIHFDKDVSASEKRELLARHRFGIHGKDVEPFGIGVAEMVLSGCLVWVPNGGGQVEIVAQPELIYADIEDAKAKIARVMNDPVRRDTLRAHLARQAGLFSVDRFKSEVRDFVLGFIQEQVNPESKGRAL